MLLDKQHRVCKHGTNIDRDSRAAPSHLQRPRQEYHRAGELHLIAPLSAVSSSSRRSLLSRSSSSAERVRGELPDGGRVQVLAQPSTL
eukprot:scaffold306519_cov14-Tisochrysis_lutea.AAC.2